MRDPEDRSKWRLDAKCWGMDPELWFPPRDKTKYKAIADKAKAVCLGKDGRPPCPVRFECLLYAERLLPTEDNYQDSTPEEHGIWGGMSHRERNALKRKLSRQGKTLEDWVNEQRY